MISTGLVRIEFERKLEIIQSSRSLVLLRVFMFFLDIRQTPCLLYYLIAYEHDCLSSQGFIQIYAFE